MKASMTLTADLLAHCERNEPDPGAEAGYRYYQDADYQAATERLLVQAPPGPLWFFAYG